MRLIASIVALALSSLTAPAASACRVGPMMIPVAVWNEAPAPDQLHPGEVVLEVTTPSASRLMNADDYRAQQSDPTLVFLPGCNPDQRTLFQIVRVISGDTHGAQFVVAPGWLLPVVPIDPATGKPFWSGPESYFVVGRLHEQSSYVVVAGDPATGVPGRPVPALDTREPPDWLPQ